VPISAPVVRADTSIKALCNHFIFPKFTCEIESRESEELVPFPEATRPFIEFFPEVLDPTLSSEE
jgi:hypothetical protein